jgi:phosphoribosylformimino-5-aminoimidazole carboxamide ribotide isomerase
MHFIPAIDVLDGRVVRLLKGSYDDVTVYADDAVAVARDHVARGADLVHVVELGSARDGTDHARTALARGLTEAGVPFQVGGGIRNAGVARTAIDAGASRVVVGTAAVADPRAFAGIVDEVGPDAVVAAIDVRDGRARGSGWEDHGAPLGEVLHRVRNAGISWALVTGISRDGTLEGPDLDLLHEVREGWPELKVIASGGVGTLDDLRGLAAAGFDAVVSGRALFEGRFTVDEAIAASG